MARERFWQGVYLGAGVLSVAVLGWLFVRLLSLVVLVLIAFIVAAGVAPLVAAIERVRFEPVRIPRALAIGFVMIAVLALFAGLGSLVVHMVSQEVEDLAVRWPNYEARVRDWLSVAVERYPWLPTQPELIEYARASASQIASLSRTGVGAVFGLLGGLASAGLVFFLTFFILMSRQAILASALRLVPLVHRPVAEQVLRGMNRKLGAWVRAQIFLAVVMGAAAQIGLSIIGVRYSFLLAVITGLGEFVPMLGPTIAGTLAVLVAVLTGGVKQALIVLIFFLALQAVENYLLVPRVMQQEVGLHPLATILALVAGGMLLGLVGAVLAVPVVAALTVPLQQLALPALARAQSGDRPG